MEWSNKIGVFTKTQGTKQQAIQKTPLVFMIYLPLIKSGPGENRTPVQTRKPYAFYMLIFAFGFRAYARPKPPTYALSPNIS